MLIEYVEAALKNAHYDIIKDEEPFYGQVKTIGRVIVSHGMNVYIGNDETLVDN